MEILVLPPGQTVSYDHYSRGRNLCTSLRDAGGNVTAITRREPESKVEGIDVIATRKNNSIQHFFAVREILSNIGEKFDIIQVTVPPDQISPVLNLDITTPIIFGPQEKGHNIPYQHFKTVLLGKLLGVSLPDILAKPTYWGAMATKKAVNPFRNYLFKRTLSEGTHITAVSSATVEYYQNLVDIPISCIPLGVRLETFTFEPNYTKNTFVCFGHLTTRKSFSTAIRAISLMETSAELKIIGSGPQSEKLHKLASKLGVEESVKFLGYVDEEKLIHEVQNATATVHPSTSEGYFHAQLESLAAGTPLIASNLKICSDIHSDREIARVCPVKDESCFAAIMDAVCKENIEFNREKCRSFVENNFNWSEIGEQYMDLYNNIQKTEP